MAGRKKKASRGGEGSTSNRSATLTSPKDIIADFVAGTSNDPEVDGDVRVLSDSHFCQRIRGVISTQCATLDVAIGRGGIPMSRLTILHGREGTGKTSVALHCVAEAQRLGGIGVFIDKEHKLAPDFAEAIGVDLSRMVVSKPKTLEGVIKQISGALRRAAEIKAKYKNHVPMVIVVDSLNACKAIETIQTPAGERRYPAEARIWSEELPDIIDQLSDQNASLIFVSQVRKKMNIQFGDDEEIAGGNAPKFYASLIIRIKRIGTEKDSSKNKTGSVVEAECKKNQIAPPFGKASFTIAFPIPQNSERCYGIDYQDSLVAQLQSMGVIKKKGNRLVVGKIDLGQGRVKAAKKVRDNPKLEKKLRAILASKMGWD